MKRSGFLWGTGLFVVLSLAWTWYAGKDLNWDFLNYHLYGPYLLLGQRLGVDYFAGSLQSYLNPLGYVPLFWMIMGGWHPLAIGAALALVHSANFALLWLITARILPQDFPHRTLACVTAVFLAFLSPLQLTTLGSTFLDPVTSLPVLASLYLLVKHAGSIQLRHAGWMGLLMGVAAGLKLTNLLLLPACLVAIEAASPFALGQTLRRAIVFSAASLLGALLTHGYWSFELWREMGNPLFPLLNGVFHSPDFPPVSFHDRRNLDRGLLSILTLPFELLSHRSWVYAENNAPDARPLALCVFLLLLVLCRLFAKSHVKASTRPDGLAFRGMLAFAGAFYLIWASTSRIGRYAFVLWLMVGPLVVATLARIPWMPVTSGLLATVIAVQLLFQHTIENPRWGATEWGTQWLDVRIPETLQTKPYAYLTLGVQSYSAIFPYFHRDSRFLNIAGQHIQPAADRMTEKFRRFVSPDLPLKVMFTAKGTTEGTLPQPLTRDVDAILSSYGLGVAMGDCQFVQINIERLVGFQSMSSLGMAASPSSFAVCEVVRRSGEEAEAALAQMAEVDRAFDNAEKACPSLLNPRGTQTMRGGKGWLRYYFNSNTQLMTEGSTLLVRTQNSMNDINLGSLNDWKSPDQHLGCGNGAATL